MGKSREGWVCLGLMAKCNKISIALDSIVLITQSAQNDQKKTTPPANAA